KGGPHPKNAPGDFYVQYGECTACGAPEPVAPDLIGWDDDPVTTIAISKSSPRMLVNWNRRLMLCV
ncbi:MAG TPA: hypothetical protein VE783_08500, partial [Candidatus Limnocylindrales bacterium]|nr:hypothetical protein [Candidatus Limnocylindrales bacterium]